MPTGYEVEMYHHIGEIARHLNRIANCLEAAERRAREQEATTPEDIERMGAAYQAVTRGFRDLEQQVQKEGQQ